MIFAMGLSFAQTAPEVDTPLAIVMKTLKANFQKLALGLEILPQDQLVGHSEGLRDAIVEALSLRPQLVEAAAPEEKRKLELQYLGMMGKLFNLNIVLENQLLGVDLAGAKLTLEEMDKTRREGHEIFKP